MQATVIRNGQHQGELFVEVQHFPDGSHASPLNYAVPVTEELPIGTVVDIVVTVATVPAIAPPGAELQGTDVSTSSSFGVFSENASNRFDNPSQTQPGLIRESAPVVPNSPLVGGTTEPTVNTSPSGQSQTPPERLPHAVAPRTTGNDETLKKKVR